MPSRHRGRYRLRASFRQALRYTFWRLGFRQSSFRHIARIFPAHRPYAWARLPVSWHAVFPGLPFRGRVSHQIQRHLLSSLPATRAIQQCASWRTKGRKQRITPLTTATAAILNAGLADRGGLPADPLFPTRRGTPLSRDALERLLTKHAATAARSCPTLREKRTTPHTLRHTTAMRLLNAGIDTAVIALWLGHAGVATTQIYVHADLALKERALARTAPTGSTPGRYQPPDTLIAFLEDL